MVFNANSIADTAIHTAINPLRVGLLPAYRYPQPALWESLLNHMQKALVRSQIQIVRLDQPFLNHRKRISCGDTGNHPSLALVDNIPIQQEQFLSSLQMQLDRTNCDVILAPAAPVEVALLKFSAPVIYLAAATTRLYQQYLNLYPDSEAFAVMERYEKTAMQKATALMYSSQSTVCSAIKDYHAEHHKVWLSPFGANLATLPLTEKVLGQRRCLNTPCRLLFLGSNWQQEGGEIAVQTLFTLLDQGLNTELIVAGCQLPSGLMHPKITVIPDTLETIASLQQLLGRFWEQIHFLLLPRQVAPYNLYLSEAIACGIPTLTTARATQTILRHGKTGYMLPINATGQDYASLIFDLWNDRTSYEQLMWTLRQEYSQHLSWDCWAERLHTLLQSILKLKTYA